ncbi:MAG TPA: 50S ribosomal protein L5, partial [Syntrophobacteraceae bacterium]|nr:50S ribosomal protein L5 [Syntrophobacteraceae bacterium]
MARLLEKYQVEVVPKLRERFQYRSSMQIPRLSKIVLNMGLGEAIQNIKILDSATEE